MRLLKLLLTIVLLPFIRFWLNTQLPYCFLYSCIFITLFVFKNVCTKNIFKKEYLRYVLKIFTRFLQMYSFWINNGFSLEFFSLNKKHKTGIIFWTGAWKYTTCSKCCIIWPSNWGKRWDMWRSGKRKRRKGIIF